MSLLVSTGLIMTVMVLLTVRKLSANNLLSVLKLHQRPALMALTTILMDWLIVQIVNVTKLLVACAQLVKLVQRSVEMVSTMMGMVSLTVMTQIVDSPY